MHKIYRLFFSKKLRLLTFNDFKRVFHRSSKLNIHNMLILSLKNNLLFPRLGMLISKKITKYAHKRNLIKRIIRENFRKIQYYLYNMDYIIIVQPNIMHFTQLSLIKKIKLLWMYYYR